MTKEALKERINDLPDECVEEVLDFVDFLIQKVHEEDEEDEAVSEGSDETEDPFWSEENQAALRRSIAQAQAGINMHEHELIGE